MRLATLSALLLVVAGLAVRADPPPGPDARRVSALVRKLDDQRYHVRRKADRQLRLLGESALPLLRAELGRARSLEVYRRLERIIHQLGIPVLVRARIVDLDSSYYIVREQADRMLRAFGKKIVPQLKKELVKATDPGVRVRLIQMIRDLSKTK